MFLQTNNANFYYELHGKGHPLILIAGYTCDYLTWMPIVDELSKHFRVLIFDNRGVGQTTDDYPSLSTKLMADDVMLLAEKLGLHKPHIVGHSMGGTIAQDIASFYSEKLNQLVIVTSSAKWRQAMLRCVKATLLMRQQNVNFDLIFEVLISQVFGEDFLSKKENVLAYKKLMLENPHPQSVDDQARQFSVLENFDGRDRLKQIQAKTLVIHGKQDRVASLDEAEYLANHIAGAELVTLDCAHAVTLEAPKPLVETLIRFL